MNEEQHIIKFEYTPDLCTKLKNDHEYNIYQYRSSKKKLYVIYTDIYYNNLNIYNSIFSNNRFDYLFNLSNMLYKLHASHYYSKIHQNKGLI